jgi:MFS family permease
MEIQTNIENTKFKKNNFFPKSKIKNIKLFYILSALNNVWFIEGNWFFFWLRFMTAGQLGLLDASVFAYGLVAEIPSGAVADLLGKRKTLIGAMMMTGVGTMFMSFAQGFWHLAIGFTIAQTGWALYSGAAEAFAYDSLVDFDEEESYDEVISASSSINRIVTVITILLGGLLYPWNFRSTHFVWSICCFIAIFVAWKLTEPKSDTEKFSFQNYLNQLKEGTLALFNKKLKFFIVIIIALLGGDFMFNWGMVKPAVGEMFGFMAQSQSLLFATFTAISAIFVKFIPQMRKKFSDKQGLFILTGLMGFSYLLAGFPLKLFGMIPMLLIAMLGTLAHPWMSIVVNKEIASKYRATALSTVALLAKIPYVALAILAGKMIDKGQLNIFLLGVGLAILLSVVLTFFVNKITKIKK